MLKEFITETWRRFIYSQVFLYFLIRGKDSLVHFYDSRSVENPENKYRTFVKCSKTGRNHIFVVKCEDMETISTVFFPTSL